MNHARFDFNLQILNSFMLPPQYNISFYLQYLARWPDIFCVQVSPQGTIIGYGKILLLSAIFIEIDNAHPSILFITSILSYGQG